MSADRQMSTLVHLKIKMTKMNVECFNSEWNTFKVINDTNSTFPTGDAACFALTQQLHLAITLVPALLVNDATAVDFSHLTPNWTLVCDFIRRTQYN